MGSHPSTRNAARDPQRFESSTSRQRRIRDRNRREIAQFFHRPRAVFLAPTIGSVPCTNPRQCSLPQPPSVLLAPTPGSAPCTDPRQCSLHQPPAVLLAPTPGSAPSTHPRPGILPRPPANGRSTTTP